MYVKDLQRDLMKWAVAREEKGLDTRSLHTAIYYLNDYRTICSQAEMIEETTAADKIEDLELPDVAGFISRI